MDIQQYKQMLEQPWGKIQYEITFAQLAHLKDKRILDFGSGLGLVSQFLGKIMKLLRLNQRKKCCLLIPIILMRKF